MIRATLQWGREYRDRASPFAQSLILGRRSVLKVRVFLELYLNRTIIKMDMNSKQEESEVCLLLHSCTRTIFEASNLQSFSLREKSSQVKIIVSIL